MPLHSPRHGAPCWFELVSRDASASMAFHQALFGWDKLDNHMGEMGVYSFLRNGTGTIGALCGLPPGAEGMPSAWNVYFLVANVDERIEQAKALGGSVIAPPFDVPGHGRGVVLADPVGAVFSLWQGASESSGDFTMFEDHSMGWVELASRDANAAKAFYGALLGWHFPPTSHPAPGVEYAEYMVGGTRYGGILSMTEQWGDTPSHWSLYIPVADVDACLARAEELGGKICVPAFDAPGVGRIGRLEDPTGAGVYVIRLAEGASNA